MADEKEPQLELKPARSKKTLIIIVVAVLLLVGGGVGGWLLLAGGEEPAPASAEQGAAADGQATGKVADAALYVGMPRAFVFNVAGKPRDRLVQIKVQLMVRGSDAEGLAKQHTPLIEGTLLRVFSAATSEQLMTFEGKEKLRKDSLEECRRVLNDLVSSPVIEQVLFTGFVMQ